MKSIITQGTALANRSILFGVALLLTACDAGVSVQALEEDPSTVHFDLVPERSSYNPLIGGTEIEGSFRMSGMIDESGTFQEVIAIGGRRVYGYAQLTCDGGSTYLQLTGEVSDDGQRANVELTFQHGKGVFEGFTGTGSFEIEVASGVPVITPSDRLTVHLVRD